VQIEMRAAMVVGERLARNAIEEAAASTDPDLKLRRIVTEFDGDRHLRASLVDREGRVLASSKLAQPPDEVPEWLDRLLAGRPRLTRLSLPSSLQAHAGIELEADPHNEIAEAWEEVGLTLTIMGIFCGLALLLTSVTLGYALRPLERLSVAFARVGGGNYGERIAERGPLELSRLYRGFNQMLDRLSDMEVRNLQLQEQLAAVQDEERVDLARDLHDEVGPLLFAVGVDATMIEQFAQSGTRGSEITARSNAIREATEHMQKHIRAMLGRLRPGVLIDVGLRPAVDNLVMSWRARQPGIAFKTSLPEQGLGRLFDEAVYRVIQESLSNAIRHGRPSQIEIGVTRMGGEVLVDVADDGKGFQLLRHKPGHGLAGMEERIKSLGGTLMLHVRPGGGVTVSARLPEKEMTEEAEPEAPIAALPA
jgi:two-component system sensor histidine kinase UhpB